MATLIDNGLITKILVKLLKENRLVATGWWGKVIFTRSLHPSGGVAQKRKSKLTWANLPGI